MSIFIPQTQQKADANRHEKNMDPYAICKYVSQKVGKNSKFCIYLIFK